MKRLLGVLLVLLTFVAPISLFAQQIPIDEATIRRELDRRGLKEEDVRQKLLERNIDIDNISVDELPALESTLEEIVQELEAESLDAIEETTKTLVDEQVKDLSEAAAQNITEAVEDGASVEEAISEELIEQINEEIPPTHIYGQQLFRDKTLKVYTSADDNRPPDGYVLGPGDQINVSIWGASQTDKTYLIDNQGYIQPDRMPRIFLKGITYEAARKLLQQRFSVYYRFLPSEFEVNIREIRNITVNIYGEVFNPGGFSISARNTAFNALVAAGGPSQIGSIRNIRLIRNNGETKQIDLYKFMLDPTVQEEFYLNNNDIIHVGVFRKRVKIRGAVHRAFNYELLEGEDLKKLIEYAGGLRSNAYRGNMQVRRYVNDQEKIIDVDWNDLTARGADFKLLNGDKIFISKVTRPFQNFVEVTGAVALPGKYEVTPNMRISDLLAKGKLEPTARTDIAYLVKTRTDGSSDYQKINLQAIFDNASDVNNVALTPRDRLQILSKTTYVDQNRIDVVGEVRRPGRFEFDPDQSIRVADAILLTGGTKPEATTFAYVHRVDSLNQKEKEYIRIDLVAALSNAASPDNLILRANDRLQIYSKLTYLDKSSINIGGAVKNPGEFPYDQTLTLTDALTLAGGLTRAAARNRVEIFRVEILDNQPTKTVVATLEIDETFQVSGKDFTLEPFDRVVVRSLPDFELQQIINIQGEVKYPGPYPIINSNETVYSILQRAGGLTREAFPGGAILKRANEKGVVVLNFDEILSDPSSPSNIILRQGDVIDIPKKKDLIGINVNNSKALELYPEKMLEAGKINVPYLKGKNAKYYIDKYAGGIGETGKKSLVVVEHPNGEIERTRNVLFFKKYPKVRNGSTISIGRKKEKAAKKQKEGQKDNTDWGKVVANSIAQITAVLSLVILAQRLD